MKSVWNIRSIATMLRFIFAISLLAGFPLIAAEELGVNSANVDELKAQGTSTPEINRLLGLEGRMGEMLGLDADWAVRAIKAGGNYGELFSRNIGVDTPIGLSRGLNLQWTEGGLLYSPPFR